PGVPVPAAWGERVRVIRGDIAHAADVRAALAGARTVLHTAAVVSDWAPRAEHERVTIDGSRHVFQEAVRQGARVALLSSCAVYGEHIGRRELVEDLALGRPIGVYSEYKQKQEALAWQFQREQGLTLSVVRPSKVFGPGSRPWVHEAAQALRRGSPALIGGGDYIPGLVYVDNLVDILLRAAALPQAVGRAYNGYDGTAATLRQYFTDLARIVGAPPPRALPRWAARLLAGVSGPLWRLLRLKSRPPLTGDTLRMLGSEYRISQARTRQELGFAPRVSYEEGLRRVEAYWRGLEAR
ncbi:MAG: NAD-dependent epimerase/dehydratase family protein, partial [Anaerolineales bacterium]|nr:NAD-dependent epimerase/dehydratase family protein [Anaerolineales bacterium]